MVLHFRDMGPVLIVVVHTAQKCVTIDGMGGFSLFLLLSLQNMHNVITRERSSCYPGGRATAEQPPLLSPPLSSHRLTSPPLLPSVLLPNCGNMPTADQGHNGPAWTTADCCDLQN